MKKFVRYPLNKQRQPIKLQPRPVNSGTNIQQNPGANRQQFLAHRAGNINDFGERGISQSDREFFDRVDRNTAAQRAEAVRQQQRGSRENFERTTNQNDPEIKKLLFQKRLEVEIAMIDKRITDILLDKKATTPDEAKQLQNELQNLMQDKNQLLAEREQSLD